jgi:hypothetical protein
MTNILENINTDNLVLISGAIFLILLLVLWHKDKSVDFDMKTALMYEGRFSLSKFGQFIALMTSTWIIIHQTKLGQLSEWLFTGYMLAWSGANLLSRYIDKSSKKE